MREQANTAQRLWRVQQWPELCLTSRQSAYGHWDYGIKK